MSWVGICLDLFANLCQLIRVDAIDLDRRAVEQGAGAHHRCHGAVLRICVVGLSLLEADLGKTVDDDAGTLTGLNPDIFASLLHCL